MWFPYAEFYIKIYNKARIFFPLVIMTFKNLGLHNLDSYEVKEKVYEIYLFHTTSAERHRLDCFAEVAFCMPSLLLILHSILLHLVINKFFFIGFFSFLFFFSLQLNSRLSSKKYMKYLTNGKGFFIKIKLTFP